MGVKGGAIVGTIAKVWKVLDNKIPRTPRLRSIEKPMLSDKRCCLSANVRVSQVRPRNLSCNVIMGLSWPKG
jgi:hypothetical protein